jgi:hypothetical protein
MNKRKEKLAKFLISVLIMIVFYGPAFILYLLDPPLSMGYIFGIAWLIVLIGVAVWFDTDPEEDEETEEDEASETGTDLDLTDEGPKTPPKLSIDKVEDQSEAMQISTSYSLSIMTKMDRNPDLL